MSHHCHAHACTVEVPPARFCCPRHWHSLRREMQDAVWREYRKGQELTKDPTARYLAVQQRAVAEIALYRPRSAKGMQGWDEAAAKQIAEPYLENSRRWRAVAVERGEGDPLAFLGETTDADL